jgi:hypothetical protein
LKSKGDIKMHGENKFYTAEEASEIFIEVVLETACDHSTVYWISLDAIPPNSDIEDSSIDIALRQYCKLRDQQTKNISKYVTTIKTAYSYPPFSRYLYEVTVID